MKPFKYLIGIDEVGRGPLAGPVAVGAVAVPYKTKHRVFSFWARGVKDSKQLSAEARQVWFGKIKAAKKKGELEYAVSLVSSKVIDEKGLSYAIRTALERSIYKIVKEMKVKPEECLLLLDGGLKAPQEFKNQRTIIRGDEKEPVIALASIAAKVTRDRLMLKYAKLYAGYGFEKHKGYGTQFHQIQIKKLGMCVLHRRSFVKSPVKV